MPDTTRLPSVREQRPLGYWLKHIDGALTENMDRLLAADGLDRRAWQVLNTLSYGPITVAALDETMTAFLSADEPTTRSQVERFVERGWAGQAGDGRVTLTEEGRRAHERASERARALRMRMMECLSADEYGVLMELLQRVATHLDALAAGEPGP
ncbi:MarR family winged helix-turn-helix transcriptional regulator [Streptomyces sp. enrichment culture]|uniref:MarR family winged helix-turn-helix transcriptional regulator n=1 Tax=Streptomyces sp. enrichment culture TaxID=1795815 RepID=UPI003F56C1BD